MKMKRIAGILLVLALCVFCMAGMAESGSNAEESPLTREEILTRELTFDDQATEIYLEEGQNAQVSLGEQAFDHAETSNAWVARGIVSPEEKLVNISAISTGEAWITLRSGDEKRSIRVVVSEPSLYTGATNGVAWSITREGVLTIFGSGSIPDFESGSTEEWLQHADEVNTILIREGVTGIGGNAFAGMNKVKSISIPATMTGIGEAFSGCQIEEVYVADLAAWVDVKFTDSNNDGVYNVEDGPTAHMKKLYAAGEAVGNILVPNGAKALSAAAFYGLECKTVYLPESLQEIEDTALESSRQASFTVIADSYAETWCKEKKYKSKAIILVDGLELSDSEVTINKEKAMTLTAKVTPSKATTKTLAWTSSNPAVVTVKDGRITAKENGTCVIKCTTTDGSAIVAECRVTVRQLVQKLNMKERKVTIPYGGTKMPDLVITPADATNQVIHWSSSNEEVCTVGEFGLITAAGAGDCEITAEATDDSGKSVSMKVHVSGLDTIEAWQEVTSQEGLVIPVSFDEVALENITHQSQDKCFLHYLDQEGIHIFPTAVGQAVISLTSKVNKTDTAKYHITVTQDAIYQPEKDEIAPMYGVLTLDHAIAAPKDKLVAKFFLNGGKKPYATIVYRIAAMRDGVTTYSDPVSVRKLAGEIGWKAEDADSTWVEMEITDENGQKLSIQSNVAEIRK